MRLIEINGHEIDLKRVQCISPVINGGYRVTLVSGWELPVDDTISPRNEVRAAWREWIKYELGKIS